MFVKASIKMLNGNLSVSGCWDESPVARLTATLAPNVGLYAARDADQQTEWEMVRAMGDLVAAYREEGARTRRELEALLRQVEREAERQLARSGPAPSPACHTALKEAVSAAPIPLAARKVTESLAPGPGLRIAPEKPAAGVPPIPRIRAALRLVGGAAPVPGTSAVTSAPVFTPGPVCTSPVPAPRLAVKPVSPVPAPKLAVKPASPGPAPRLAVKPASPVPVARATVQRRQPARPPERRGLRRRPTTRPPESLAGWAGFLSWTPLLPTQPQTGPASPTRRPQPPRLTQDYSHPIYRQKTPDRLPTPYTTSFFHTDQGAHTSP